MTNEIANKIEQSSKAEEQAKEETEKTLGVTKNEGKKQN